MTTPPPAFPRLSLHLSPPARWPPLDLHILFPCLKSHLSLHAQRPTAAMQHDAPSANPLLTWQCVSVHCCDTVLPLVDLPKSALIHLLAESVQLASALTPVFVSIHLNTVQFHLKNKTKQIHMIKENKPPWAGSAVQVMMQL